MLRLEDFPKLHADLFGVPVCEFYGRSPLIVGLERAREEQRREDNWAEWSALMHAEPV